MRVAPGVKKYAVPPLVAAGPAFLLSPTLGTACFALAVFVVWFHRDPDRVVPEDSGAIAPADGKVSVIREEDDGRWRVGIYMNVFDVHVNRAAFSGTVEAVEHRPGAHKPAFDKDSEHNEQVVFDVGDHEVVLIAGAFARRIHPYLEAGDEVERGERIGHVSFGSRADVVLPAGFDREDIRVETGETVVAGETILANRRGSAD
jgi:phosphatidylserine decarboxylase